MPRIRPVGAARASIVVIYALGALSHVYFFTQHPELYRSVADEAILPFYRDLWQSLVVPTVAWSPAFVILFEAAVAAASAGRGRAVVLANLAAAAFQVGLAPLGAWGVINLGLAALHAWIARAALRGSFATNLWPRGGRGAATSTPATAVR